MLDIPGILLKILLNYSRDPVSARPHPSGRPIGRALNRTPHTNLNTRSGWPIGPRRDSDFFASDFFAPCRGTASGHVPAPIVDVPDGTQQVTAQADREGL